MPAERPLRDALTPAGLYHGKASRFKSSAPSIETDWAQENVGAASAAARAEESMGREPLSILDSPQQQFCMPASAAEGKAAVAKISFLDRSGTLPMSERTGLGTTEEHTPSAAADDGVHRAQVTASAGQSITPLWQQQQQCTPLIGQARSQRRHSPLSPLSRAKTLLRMPGALIERSPLQLLTLPRLKSTPAVKGTPGPASKQMPAGQQADRLTPQIGHLGRQSMQPQTSGRVSTGALGSKADLAIDLRTPGTLTIPRLKATSAARLGQSPLAFPGLSPQATAAQTPQFRGMSLNSEAEGSMGRRAAPHATEQSRQQQDAAACVVSTPLLQTGGALSAVSQQAQGAERAAAQCTGAGFGSPLLIHETPQDNFAIAHRQPLAAAHGAADDGISTAPVAASASAVDSRCAEQKMLAPASQRAEAGPALQQPCDSAVKSSTASQRLAGAEAGVKCRKASRKAKTGSTGQQENSGAPQGQQVGSLCERQPLTVMNGAATNNAEASEASGKGRKRRRGAGSQSVQTQETCSVAGHGTDTHVSQAKQPGMAAASMHATRGAEAEGTLKDVSAMRNARAGSSHGNSSKTITGVLGFSSGVAVLQASTISCPGLCCGGARNLEPLQTFALPLHVSI